MISSFFSQVSIGGKLKLLLIGGVSLSVIDLAAGGSAEGPNKKNVAVFGLGFWSNLAILRHFKRKLAQMF